MSDVGLKRLQHLVLWVGDVERSVGFYRDVLGFEVAHRYPNAAFLRIAGSGLGISEAADACAVHGVPAVRVCDVGDAIAVRTVPVSWSRLTPLVDMLRAIGADVLALPVIDGAVS